MYSITDIKVLKDYIRMCSDGVALGWHERNGGNLTYRMKAEEVEQCRPFFREQPGDWVPMGVQADNLKGEYFIATGSGKYLRNVELEPQNNICILEINGAGDSWRIVWGLENGGKPTSEFPSHYMNHSVKKRVTGGANRVIYHAHPPYVVALSYILPLSAEAFYPAAVEERDGVLRGVPGRRWGCALDGAGGSGDRQGYMRGDGEI